MLLGLLTGIILFQIIKLLKGRTNDTTKNPPYNKIPKF